MRRIAGVTLVASLLALPLPVQAETYRFSATAENYDGTPLYQERHRIEGECRNGRFREQKQHVDYISLTEKLGNKEERFATKSLSFEHDRQRPSVEFSQPLFDERMQISNIDDEKANVVWRTPKGETEQHSLPLSRQAVIDAGFVHFIRAHWATLTEGRQVDFDFVVPTRGEAYRFVAEPTENTHIDAHLVVSLRPSQVFLRWIVDPIFVGFDAKGRITDYRGLSNIRKNGDRNYTVHLHYDTGEPPCPLLP